MIKKTFSGITEESQLFRTLDLVNLFSYDRLPRLREQGAGITAPA
jgi:hypothetical protein